MGSEPTTFRDVLVYAIGGGWGAENPDPKHTVPVSIIRGTDFARLSTTEITEVPQRYETPAKVAKRTLKPGDILLEISGGSPAKGQTTGRTCFISPRVLELFPGPAIPASFCRLVRVDTKKVLPRFAYYWLQDMYKSGRAAAYENQSTGISNFQFERFLDAEAINLPHLNEQFKVVEILGTLDDCIDNLRRVNATLEAIAQALFKSWFVDFDPVRAKAQGREPEGMDAATAALFPSEFVDSAEGPIPKGWSASALSDALEINPKRELKKGIVAPYLDMASIPTVGCVPRPPVYREFSSGPKFTNGDTLLARITPCLENGKTAYVSFLEHEQVGWGSTEFIVLRPRPPLPSFFAYLLARRNDFRAHAIQSMSGTSGRQRVELTRLQDFIVTVPNAAVAGAFAEIIEPIERMLLINAEYAGRLAAIRDTLLPRLISGKLGLPMVTNEEELMEKVPEEEAAE